MKVFLLQFLHKGIRLLARVGEGKPIRHNTTSFGTSQRLDNKLERLVLRRRLAFFCMLYGTDLVFFRYLGVTVIVICNDLPVLNYIQIRLSGRMKYITGFTMFGMNEQEMTTIRLMAILFTETDCTDYIFNDCVFARPVPMSVFRSI